MRAGGAAGRGGIQGITRGSLRGRIRGAARGSLGLRGKSHWSQGATITVHIDICFIQFYPGATLSMAER